MPRRIIEGKVLHCYFMSIGICSKYSRKTVCPWVGAAEKKVGGGAKHTKTVVPCADVATSIGRSSSRVQKGHLRLTAWGLVASHRGAGLAIAEVRHFR